MVSVVGFQVRIKSVSISHQVTGYRDIKAKNIMLVDQATILHVYQAFSAVWLAPIVPLRITVQTPFPTGLHGS
jgi:hypothetical protein